MEKTAEEPRKKSGKKTSANPVKKQNAPQGTRQGAWEVGEGKVRFALWAPWKKGVSLVGDFNDWDPQADPMAVGKDGVWWTEKELAAGAHHYLFIVGGETYVGDPYAREVDWTGDGPHALVRVGEEPFAWMDGEFHVPEAADWVIYEAHVGDFTQEGTFVAMTEKLDYLKELGVNALELMPIFEFPGDFSWGYNAVYMLAPEKSYGSLRELMTLIDEAHARGIAIVLDMVFNHVGDEHPFVALYPYGDSPFFGTDTNPWGFPDLNHWSEAVKSYVHQVQTYWLNDLHIDAFRYDATAYIGYDGFSGVSYIAHDAREIKPHVRLIAEEVPEDPNLVNTTEINAAWHERWHHIVTAQLRYGEFKGAAYGDMAKLKGALDPRSDGYGGALDVINYLESHDQQRLIYEIKTNPEVAKQALARSVLGAALLLTAPGTPMLYHGQELADEVEKSMEKTPLPWERLEHDDGVKWLHGCYQRLVWLRRERSALKTDRVDIWYEHAEHMVLVYQRSTEGEDTEVIVMLNFSPDQQELAFDLPRGGAYHEVISGEDWTLQKGRYETSIPGAVARVLKRVSG